MEEGKLFQLGKELGEVASSITDSLEDNKISIMEGVGIAKEMGQLGLFGYKHREELIGYFKDGIDIYEKTELYNGFKEGYEVECEKIEELVETMFDGALHIATGISILFDVRTQKKLMDNEEEEATPEVDDYPVEEKVETLDEDSVDEAPSIDEETVEENTDTLEEEPEFESDKNI
jgi:hypothetical protein